MQNKVQEEFFDVRAELVKEREAFEEKYGEYKDPVDKLAAVFHFKPTDYILKDFYFTLEGVTLSLPYPTLSTFNHVINIIPKEPTPALLSVWSFYAVWILSVYDTKGEEWLSFRKTYEQGLPDLIAPRVAQTRMTRDIKKRFLPRGHKKKVHLLFEGFVLMMDDISARMGSEKVSELEYAHCYTLLGETEGIYSIAKDFGLLPHVFMDDVNIAEFAALLSSADRLGETERRVNEAMVADTTSNTDGYN